MSGKPIYYWDTSVWLAWLKGETREAGEMEGVAEIAQEVVDGEAVLITSTITRIEILETRLEPNQRNKFLETLESSGITEVDLDPFVAEIASEIRDYYILQRPDGSKMSVPDAIHLATAIHSKATEFSHFEKGEKSISFSKLGSMVADKYPLNIKCPMKSQTELKLIDTDPPKEK